MAQHDGLHMTDIATKNGAVIFKDGAAAENCDCCGGWYCYCPTPELVDITLSDYFSNYVRPQTGFAWNSIPVNGTYRLNRLSCYGPWVYTLQRGGCDAASGGINGIGLDIGVGGGGLRARAGSAPPAYPFLCDGWSVDSERFIFPDARSIYAAVCGDALPLSGTVVNRSGSIIYFSFSWSISKA